jgi:hypothetical protein
VGLAKMPDTILMHKPGSRNFRRRCGGWPQLGHLGLAWFGESGDTRSDFKRIPEDVDTAV